MENISQALPLNLNKDVCVILYQQTSANDWGNHSWSEVSAMNGNEGKSGKVPGDLSDNATRLEA